jgi:hypothetical protein
MAPEAGFEPATRRLTVACSTAELLRKNSPRPAVCGLRRRGLLAECPAAGKGAITRLRRGGLGRTLSHPDFNALPSAGQSYRPLFSNVPRALDPPANFDPHPIGAFSPSALGRFFGPYSGRHPGSLKHLHHDPAGAPDRHALRRRVRSLRAAVADTRRAARSAALVYGGLARQRSLSLPWLRSGGRLAFSGVARHAV